MDLAAYLRVTELADYIVPFTIRAVCELGVADELVSGAVPVGELAARVGADASALHRALRALASKGIFSEVEPGVFGLTALAQPLRSDHPLSLRDAYPLLAADVSAWGRFDHCVRTGEASFDVVHGVDYWSWLATHPRESRATDAAMRSITALHLRTVLGAYPWGSLGSVVDVGGGNGAFLAGILARFPRLRGTVFDLPHVVAGAAEVLAGAGVADRAEVVAGSFFDAGAIPAGADAYLMKTVLPGFTDERAAAALRSVRAAMRPDSALILLEAVIGDGDGYDAAKLMDVHALMLTGGAHRTATGLAALLAAAGLRLRQLRATATLTAVVAGPDDPDDPDDPTDPDRDRVPAERSGRP